MSNCFVNLYVLELTGMSCNGLTTKSTTTIENTEKKAMHAKINLNPNPKQSKPQS
jgi:hypothetical protein